MGVFRLYMDIRFRNISRKSKRTGCDALEPQACRESDPAFSLHVFPLGGPCCPGGKRRGGGALEGKVYGGAGEELEVPCKFLADGQTQLDYAVDGSVCEFPVLADAEGLDFNLAAPAFLPADACAESESDGIFHRR